MSSAGDYLTLYGYTPSKIASIVFIIVFALLTISHIHLVVKSRIVWLSVAAVGGILEVIGFVGRLLSHSNPASINPFLIQIICAFLYGTTAMLINALGNQYSKLRSNLYMLIFCICDLLAIGVQAIGGGMAAVALKKDSFSLTGTRIMVAGISLQLASMIVFCYLLFDFYVGARHGEAYAARTAFDQGRIKRLVRGLFIASGLILLRCIYRTIELGQGWTGYFITHEAYFIFFDSVPMVCTMAALIYAHPVFCLLGSGKDSNAVLDGSAASSISSEKIVEV